MGKLVLAASAALFLGVAGAALAQETAPHPSVREACAQDFRQYCADAHTHDERRQCREQNQDKFSDACKAALAAAEARHSGR